MRLMIHIIGDIHQPLHTSTLFSELFPDGDMGGNKFEIVYLKKKSLSNLHSFWDSTSHLYGEIKVPLTESTYERLQGYAEEITTEFSRDAVSAELKKHSDFDGWVIEGGEKALSSAYENQELKSGDTITDEYLEQSQKMVQRQIALGGYRLADWLVTVLGAKKAPVTVSE